MQKSKESKAMSKLLKHLFKSVPRESIPWQERWGSNEEDIEIWFENLAHSNILDRLLNKEGITHIFSVNLKTARACRIKRSNLEEILRDSQLEDGGPHYELRDGVGDKGIIFNAEARRSSGL